MSDRKATNKYYPPDFDPKVHRSLNAYHGSHPLRARARKLDQGILVIRFEMPFPIWCGGCSRHIAKGVRFNAEKRKVGNYFTTDILEFVMKCATCKHKIVVQTDPKNSEYVVTEGGTRKEEGIPAGDGRIVIEDEETRERRRADPLMDLEHKEQDSSKALADHERIAALQEAETFLSKNDYALSSKIRHERRVEKSKRVALQTHADAMGLGIELLEEHEDDGLAAKAAVLNRVKPVKKRDVASESILPRMSFTKKQRRGNS